MALFFALLATLTSFATSCLYLSSQLPQPSARTLVILLMSSLEPTKSSPYRRYEWVSGHHINASMNHPSTPARQSPYSSYFSRVTLKPRNSHDHQDCLPPFSGTTCRASQAGPSRSQRFPLPRYQTPRGPVPRQDLDTATPAIRSMYAEVIRQEIPILIGRLERLSLDDHMVWEDTVRRNVSVLESMLKCIARIWMPLLCGTLVVFCL